MKLEGFESLWHENKIIEPGNIYHLSLSKETYQKQYNIFKEKVYNCIGKTFLPIYRMSDGEFKFCLGKTSIKKKILSGLKISKNYSGTCWGESYTKKEIKSVYPYFIKSLKKISEHGLLALHFLEAAGFERYAVYTRPMCDWFDRNEIELTESNYISFYFVYALLSGGDSLGLFKNRKILIITSSYGDNFARLEKELSSRYYSEVSFYEISRSKSLLEKINLKKIDRSADVVLIGAGSSLKTVCIDSGIFLEMLVNKNLNTSRLFLKENRLIQTKDQQNLNGSKPQH